MENNAGNAEIKMRSYLEGDAKRIVDFLNLCYGNWGTLEKWAHLYIVQPLFSKSDVTVAETGGKIIGYGGMHSRYMAIDGNEVLIQLVGDGAVDPAYRGMRLHSKLLKERFNRAGDKNACLCFGWVLRNSDAYRSDMRVGFVEANQFPTYLRILNYSSVLKAGISDLLAKNKRLNNSLHSVGYPIYFKTGTSEFQLPNSDDKEKARFEERIEIFLSEGAIKEIYSFRSLSTKQRIILLANLLLLRKMRFSFPSFQAFISFVKNAGNIAKSL